MLPVFKAPTFLVPEETPETQEAAYAALARLAQQPVPILANRIYSITYMNRGEEWTTTVGESLLGIRRRTTRSRGKKIEKVQHVSDPALVLAIFPGVPYVVVTNYRLDGNIRSAWENPFLAGVPKSVTRFSLT